MDKSISVDGIAIDGLSVDGDWLTICWREIIVSTTKDEVKGLTLQQI